MPKCFSLFLLSFFPSYLSFFAIFLSSSGTHFGGSACGALLAAHQPRGVRGRPCGRLDHSRASHRRGLLPGCRQAGERAARLAGTAGWGAGEVRGTSRQWHAEEESIGPAARHRGVGPGLLSLMLAEVNFFLEICDTIEQNITYHKARPQQNGHEISKPRSTSCMFFELRIAEGDRKQSHVLLGQCEGQAVSTHPLAVAVI